MVVARRCFVGPELFDRRRFDSSGIGQLCRTRRQLYYKEGYAKLERVEER